MTTNDFGVPEFAGNLLGKSDMIVKFKFGAKLKQRFVSLTNITYIGGYIQTKNKYVFKFFFKEDSVFGFLQVKPAQ